MQSSSVLRTAGVVRLLGDLLSGDTDLLVFRRFDSQSVLPDRLIWLENDGAFPPSFVEHEISTSDSEVQIQTGDLDGGVRNFEGARVFEGDRCSVVRLADIPDANPRRRRDRRSGPSF